MELYIFNKEINFKGIIENYFSLRWVRRYHKSGEFELHANLNKETLDLLKIGNIVYKKDDLEGGVIEHLHLKLDETGKEVIVVTGKFLTGLLSRRIIWKTENIKSSAEVAIRTLIENNVINPTNTERKIDLVELGQLHMLSGEMNYQVSYNNLLDELERINLSSDLGIRSILDVKNKKIRIESYRGVDRTANQSIEPPALFSREFENVLSQEYINSALNYKNIALVGGEGEGSLRTFVTEGFGSGIDRYEVFIDSKDIQREEMTESEYTNKLIENGKLKLSEFQFVKSFDSKINLKGNLEYKKDFDVGDKVTFISKTWNVMVDSRITEVEEIYEENGTSINAVFGNEMPTLIEKIRAVI